MHTSAIPLHTSATPLHTSAIPLHKSAIPLHTYGKSYAHGLFTEIGIIQVIFDRLFVLPVYVMYAHVFSAGNYIMMHKHMTSTTPFHA